ncbi:IclR family transcriptional regulator [Streptomyces aurantiacus]|uniref:IclR family transcriptional regulator n=1 Tax=Streptomyces aurantiacus TaxID=47760 RepID=UPI0024BF793D|nr:IclR family transcriptional regulator [Streptomyces aurantiacus]
MVSFSRRIGGHVKQQSPSSAASPGGGRDVGNVRAVQRAARIVTALTEHPYPLGIVELAKFVRLSPGSVHRLLATLVSVGWVEQNSRTSKYRLGMGAVGIGSVALVTNPVVHDGRAHLARVAQWSGHDAVLSTLVGGRTVQLARAAGINTDLIEFEPGHPQPAHAMADGKLLLAFLSEEELADVLGVEELRRFTPNTITDLGGMRREFDEIRARGYSVDNFERFDTGRGVAVPVVDSGGRPLAAMMCLGKLDPAQDAELVQQLQSVAREMSDRLNATGDLPSSSFEPTRAAVRVDPGRG